MSDYEIFKKIKEYFDCFSNEKNPIYFFNV